MKGFLKFIAVFAAILLLSAVLAPLFFNFFQTFHPYKFERIFNRIVMILSLVAVACFVRVKREMLTSYGLAWKPQSLELLAKGFKAGVLVLGAVGILRFLLGQAVFAPDSLSWEGWTAKVFLALGTALLIGFIEEFFFRGFIFRSLMRLLRDRVFLSVIITTSFYAIIHFIGMKKIFVDSSPNWIDGLRLVGAPFFSLAQWPKFWPEVVGLFLFGLALNGVAYRSGSLYPAIGFHAGCVFFVRLDDSFLQFQKGRTLFWGSKVLYDGLVGWFFLALMVWFFWRVLKPGTPGPASSSRDPKV
ncbi:MAG: CPBP family intramembrane glutamic endopeptidase [Candidatus Omnitrophota bacterium]